MSEPEAFAPTAAELLEKIKDRARANGADPVALAEDQLVHLASLSDGLAGALGGDERLQAHLSAQLAQAAFSAKAEAYLEAVAWRKAIQEVLTEIAVQAGKAAIAAAASGLASSLAGSLGSEA